MDFPQLKGVRFMWDNVGAFAVGCVLAHAPGLGKTLQIITFCHSFAQYWTQVRVLFVCPSVFGCCSSASNYVHVISHASSALLRFCVSPQCLKRLTAKDSKAVYKPQVLSKCCLPVLCRFCLFCSVLCCVSRALCLSSHTWLLILSVITRSLCNSPLFLSVCPSH